MRLSNKVQAVFLCLCIGAGIVTRINRKTTENKWPPGPASEFIQVKNTNAGTVSVQLMPVTAHSEPGMDDVFTILVIVKCYQPVRQPAIMQYMNFNIRNSFRAVQGGDTLPCIICERIPGINGNDFLYLACFKRLCVNNDDDRLRIYITDTIAGFGNNVFEMENRR